MNKNLDNRTTPPGDVSLLPLVKNCSSGREANGVAPHIRNAVVRHVPPMSDTYNPYNTHERNNNQNRIGLITPLPQEQPTPTELRMFAGHAAPQPPPASQCDWYNCYLQHAPCTLSPAAVSSGLHLPGVEPITLPVVDVTLPASRASALRGLGAITSEVVAR